MGIFSHNRVFGSRHPHGIVIGGGNRAHVITLNNFLSMDLWAAEIKGIPHLFTLPKKNSITSLIMPNGKTADIIIYDIQSAIPLHDIATDVSELLTLVEMQYLTIGLCKVLRTIARGPESKDECVQMLKDRDTGDETHLPTTRLISVIESCETDKQYKNLMKFLIDTTSHIEETLIEPRSSAFVDIAGHGRRLGIQWGKQINHPVTPKKSWLITVGIAGILGVIGWYVHGLGMTSPYYWMKLFGM